MDLSVLKKKLSVYRDTEGSVKNVSDDLLYELLTCWEGWDGSSKDFYSALGTNRFQLAGVIGKAKRYKREGRFGNMELQEAMIEDHVVDGSSNKASGGKVLELVWPDGRLVRFCDLDSLIEFIRRTA